MSRWVIIECKNGLRAKAIRVFFIVISECMMSPMLRHPVPFVRSNKIRSESKQVIHPGAFGGGTVISIMLHIQSNKRLSHTKHNCHKHSTLVPVVVVKESCGGGKLVLHKEEESNVAERTEEVAGCSELTTSAYNLEYFPFDVAFKLGIEFVFGFIIHNLSNLLHLLQVLTSMVRMDHPILHSHIITTKELDHLTTGMDKVGNIVNNSVNCNFSALEALHCANRLQCWVIVEVLG
mmetsp:Transcript_31142/g.40274  ORF Transcript_31142/g.40274 Transcript_31142/m.40274 type:complete len:235 (-) Transcript_31142:87-791(-)